MTNRKEKPPRVSVVEETHRLHCDVGYPQGRRFCPVCGELLAAAFFTYHHTERPLGPGEGSYD